MRIDADAHVDETEATWEYMQPHEGKFAATTLDPMPSEGVFRADQRWRFDDVTLRRPVRDYGRTGATMATSQLLDVGSGCATWISSASTCRSSTLPSSSAAGLRGTRTRSWP
jgi:hypothetical protein